MNKHRKLLLNLQEQQKLNLELDQKKTDYTEDTEPAEKHEEKDSHLKHRDDDDDDDDDQLPEDGPAQISLENTG